MRWKSNPVADAIEAGALEELATLLGAESVRVPIGIASGLTLAEIRSLPGCLLSEHRLWPKSAGIYLLLEGRRLRYIGSALNIPNRVSHHKTYGGWPSYTKMKWILCERSQELLMRWTEHKLIFKHCPDKNVQGNPASNNPYSCVCPSLHRVAR